jgi:hypothetical protein
MQPIFTVHAGEFLVANHIQDTFKADLNIWIPAKDTGIDLLVTNRTNKRSVSLQVKFSRSYLSPNFSAKFQGGLKSCGWWNFDEKKIEKSPADYWVLVIVGVDHPSIDYVVVKPQVLLSRLRTLRPNEARRQSYLWVTMQSRCWETRGLLAAEQQAVAANAFRGRTRDFTPFLNNWKPLHLLAKK